MFSVCPKTYYQSIAIGFTTDGFRRVGRPKENWRRTKAKDKQEKHIDVELEDLAQRRGERHNIITVLWVTSGLAQE